MNNGNNGIICILLNRVKRRGSSHKGFVIFLIILAMLSFFPNRCSALPVWPVTEDPNGRDIIGFEDSDGKEFGATFGSEVIEYQIGIDEWSKFPQRLKPKVNTSQPYPHTVNIRFNADPTTDSWNLSLGLYTNELSDQYGGQYLGIFFDGHPIHPLGGKWIQMEANFRQYDFWLGSIAQGEHTIKGC